MVYRIRLEDSSSKQTISEDYQSDAMTDAVNVFINEFDLLDYISLPYKMRKKAVLNSSPTHPNGSNMRSYRRVSEDIFLNVDLPGRTKMSQIRRMASDCDIIVSFEGWPTYKREG